MLAFGELQKASDLFSGVHFSFVPPLCWPPLFLSFSGRLFALFFPSESALLLSKGHSTDLAEGSFRMDVSTKSREGNSFRNLREKGQALADSMSVCFKHTRVSKKTFHYIRNSDTVIRQQNPGACLGTTKDENPLCGTF